MNVLSQSYGGVLRFDFTNLRKSKRPPHLDVKETSGENKNEG